MKTSFINELGHEIKLEVTRSGGMVHIKLIGPDSTGEFFITDLEANEVMKALIKTL